MKKCNKLPQKVVIRSQMETVKELGSFKDLSWTLRWSPATIHVEDEVWLLEPFVNTGVIDAENSIIIYAIRDQMPYQKATTWRLFQVKLAGVKSYYFDRTERVCEQIFYYLPNSASNKRVYYVSKRRKV
jgi:hypothetical protein